MEFYAQNGGKRPIRLSDLTRKFAQESLGRKYGLDTLKTSAISLDDIENFPNLTSIEKYDIAIRRIAENAPIRICDGEKLSGAATLGLAIRHQVPATYAEKPVCASISHLTVNFENVLKNGIQSIREKAEYAFTQHQGTEKEPFARSCLNCLDAFEIWHDRRRRRWYFPHAPAWRNHGQSV